MFEELERRLKTLLPEEYRDRYDAVQPVSMGTAGVRYGPDGKVAWDQMWGSFCDLALAGGPPHKGTLLEPAWPGEIQADPAAYAAVVAEICRGIMMVTDLEAAPAVDLFVAYAGVVDRPAVSDAAPVVIRSASLAPVLPLVLDAADIASADDHDLYQKGVALLASDVTDRRR